MRIRRHLALCIVLLSGLAAGPITAQQGKQPSAKGQLAAADARAADRAAIRKVFDSFAKTFEQRDAKVLAGHFTTEGEFQNAQGVQLRGREALERAFVEFFAKTPEVTADVQPETLRFLSGDSAIDEGLVTVQSGPAEAATKARYSALVVREGGMWRLALLTESPAAAEPSIADLAWLIGQWKSTSGAGADIATTYSWVPGKKFIHMEFTIKEAKLALGGTQMIGVDPATGMLHTWTFETGGGIGEADWYRDGDHWVLDAAGTRADGSSLMEANILRRIDDDTFTWQSINRTLNDAELADLAPVKVTRIKTQP